MITAHHLVFGRNIDFSDFLYSEINSIVSYLPITKNGTVTYTKDRKGGNTAIQLGSGNLKTTSNLPTSNIWSFSFWIKTSQTSVGHLFVVGLNNTDGDFYFSINDVGLGKLQIGCKTTTSFNVKYANNVTMNDNTWKHIVVILNSNLDALNDISVYINSVKQTLTTQVRYNNDKTTAFASKPLYIGGYNNTTFTYVGAIGGCKIYNRELTQTEIDNLYNE